MRVMGARFITSCGLLVSRAGKLKNFGLFRKGSRDWSDLRFTFEPVNDCIVITSTKNGDVAANFIWLSVRVLIRAPEKEL